MFVYTIKSGFKNLGAKKLFTFASIATIACSVFVFSIFFALFTNIQNTIRIVESTIGIQVFFDQNLTEEQIQNIANNNFYTSDVKQIKFISGEEAWTNFKSEYFENKEELALAFEDDNPLSHSASYEILLNDIERQEDYVKYLYSINGVRQVNYSSSLISMLTRFNEIIGYFSLSLVFILLIIAVILISNTITVTSQYRFKENEIMKLIGATNFMVRMPFVIEGMLIGVFGAIISTILASSLYIFVSKRLTTSANLIFDVFRPLPLSYILPSMCIISFVVSIVVCTFISFITISNNVK